MLFTSLHFALFLPLVFILYWFVAYRSLTLQNILLLVASYFFYACWDWRFLFLLVFSTLLDYYTGIKIAEAQRPASRKFWLVLSIAINLGFLGVFKYYNFFATSFAEGLTQIGWHVDPFILNLILPIGISFYTFHGLSYVIDIYNTKISPERNFIDYSLFVSFFPLLVAGPIERATHLLPQLKEKKTFQYTQAADGLRQILWGLFKKVVIADQCAIYVNMIFNSQEDFSGSTYVLGAVLFAFQIYGDFSGYSDIALGAARLFGIELLRNFAFPYFSRDIAEFWRRWHISLSSWFRDYLYIPLGGSKGSTAMKVRNVVIIFLISGFWHGANWTFIIWGLLNALYILPSIFFNTHRTHLDSVAQGKYLPTLKEFFSMLLTFSLTVFAWIFFRSANLGEAFHYISIIFSGSLFTKPSIIPLLQLLLVSGFVLIEWFGREQSYAIAQLGLRGSKIIRWGIYYILILSIIYFTKGDEPFIYFQF
ncbi:MAG: D-alanyl-lipoteichoic acid acyltransferase DltB, superfamily [Chitinophagaceae bacterium]|nr:D-alanyl-lipoteichoic acid acyltransferase DltB, superfamily [Chitinophagaceae bacterium]